MPTYEYRCVDCGGMTEEVHSVRDFPRSTKCWGCGGEARKIISRAHFSMDKVRDEGFNHGLGRSFSSRSERNAHLKEIGAVEAYCPTAEKQAKEGIAELKELKRDREKREAALQKG